MYMWGLGTRPALKGGKSMDHIGSVKSACWLDVGSFALWQANPNLKNLCASVNSMAELSACVHKLKVVDRRSSDIQMLSR